MKQNQSISDQIRTYNEMFPPSDDVVSRLRDHWNEPHNPNTTIAVSISDEDVARYLAIRARNDNMPDDMI